MMAGRDQLRERSDGALTNGALARRSLVGEDGWLRTVKSCGPDASRLASSPAEAKLAQPGGSAIIRGATVTNKS
jgi:hypothetical protein